jgi:hypothetical protein
VEKKPSTSKAQKAEIELKPGAWPRFENLVRQAAKVGPKPRRPKTKQKKRG